MYDKNLSGCKSEAISVRLLFSIVINLSTISQNLLESRDFTILLRSNGNQALKTARNSRDGNYSVEFCQMHAAHAWKSFSEI